MKKKNVYIYWDVSGFHHIQDIRLGITTCLYVVIINIKPIILHFCAFPDLYCDLHRSQGCRDGLLSGQTQ